MSARTALTALCRRTSASASAVSRRQFGNTCLAKGGASPPLPPFARNPGEFFARRCRFGRLVVSHVSTVCDGILAMRHVVWVFMRLPFGRVTSGRAEGNAENNAYMQPVDRSIGCWLLALYVGSLVSFDLLFTYGQGQVDRAGVL